MVRGRARGGKGSLCPPSPPPNTPNRPTWTPTPTLPEPPPPTPPRTPHHSPSLDPPYNAPPPPPQKGASGQQLVWGGSWRPEPRGCPPPPPCPMPYPRHSPGGVCCGGTLSPWLSSRTSSTARRPQRLHTPPWRGGGGYPRSCNRAPSSSSHARMMTDPLSTLCACARRAGVGMFLRP